MPTAVDYRSNRELALALATVRPHAPFTLDYRADPLYGIVYETYSSSEDFAFGDCQVQVVRRVGGYDVDTRDFTIPADTFDLARDIADSLTVN